MSTKDRISLHRGRALEELARARGAACPEAAMAHLALSQLHLGEVRALSCYVDLRPRLALVG